MSKCIASKIKFQKFYLDRILLILENFSPRNILASYNYGKRLTILKTYILENKLPYSKPGNLTHCQFYIM